MSRENLQKVLCQYITDTFSYIGTVRSFCEEIPEWIDARTKERRQINGKEINLGHLSDVLKDTVEGLKKMDFFLDAVEKLAVTSWLVFRENQAVNLSEKTRDGVCNVITVARLICHHLLDFKRDAEAFFSPRLQNVEVFSYELDKYIKTTKNICKTLKKSCISDINLDVNKETLVHLDEYMSEDVMQKMLCHNNQLTEIRMDPHFRMVFLFQEEPCSAFIKEFKERYPRMLQSLKELEENAVQLDRMNKGAKISSVVGSSVGAAGGVLAIVGLVLSPFTAGLSLGMVIGGSAMGITSGVNSIVTTATEIGVNHKHQNEASEVFRSFIEDMQCIQDCLVRASSHAFSKIEASGIDGAAVAQAVEKSADTAEDIVSIVNEVKDVKVLCKVPTIASNTANVGFKGALGLSKSARVGLIAANALFFGMDIFFICKDSITLAKGTETEVSQFIRARAELWCSEIDSWEKICDSLSEGLQKFEEKKAILDMPFYPEKK